MFETTNQSCVHMWPNVSGVSLVASFPEICEGSLRGRRLRGHFHLSSLYHRGILEMVDTSHSPLKMGYDGVLSEGSEQLPAGEAPFDVL